MKPPARLLFADSDRHADPRYATGVFVPDPFLWVQVGRRRLALVSPLEFGRLQRALHPGTEVLNLADARRLLQCRDLSAAGQIAAVSRYLGVRRWTVGADFPLALARRVARRGVVLSPAKGPLFPERECKSAAEAKLVEQGVRLAEAGLVAALAILRQARIVRDELRWQGRALTSELLRGEIEAVICRRGGVALHTIVAGGPAGADPHEAGPGPLRPHQPIILDIFPQVAATGYYGDLTRTVVKGRAPDLVRRAFAAVRRARDLAIRRLKPGVTGKAIHQLVCRTLADAGFETDAKASPPHGFFHGTGHGLGLEIHEAPRLSLGGGPLRTGHVVTVEPGLYYREWGGVRLEDVVWLVPSGCRNLTRVPSVLELD